MNINTRFNKDEAIEYVNQMRNEFSLILNAIDIIKDIISHHNGAKFNASFVRVINKSLAVFGSSSHDAINPVNSISVKITSSLSLFFRLNPRSFQMKNGQVIYLDTEFSDYTINGFGVKATDKGCIVAEKAIDLLAAYGKQLNDTLHIYQDAVNHWDEHISQMNKINNNMMAQLLQVNPLFIADNATDLFAKRIKTKR